MFARPKSPSRRAKSCKRFLRIALESLEERTLLATFIPSSTFDGITTGGTVVTPRRGHRQQQLHRSDECDHPRRGTYDLGSPALKQGDQSLVVPPAQVPDSRSAPAATA